MCYEKRDELEEALEASGFQRVIIPGLPDGITAFVGIVGPEDEEESEELPPEVLLAS